VLPVEGGWSAVVRIPTTETDEDFAVRMIEDHGVVIHPGYFFDFPADGYVVISLLTKPDIFDLGIGRVFDALPKG